MSIHCLQLSRPFLRVTFVAATILAFAVFNALTATAGQVRVNVGQGGNLFAPATQSLNQGDQVVWIWVGGFHDVTSGTPASPNTIFGSGPAGSGLRYSWKSDRSGALPYFCSVHSTTMFGSLSISATGINSVASFRITEVFFSGPGNQDFIELANLGNAPGNLGQYRVSVAAGTSFLLQLLDIAVAPGGRVVLHLNQSGTNTQTDLFIPGVSLGRSGSVALYLPSTVNPSLTDANMMVDFVQWGAAGQPNEATANTAGLWTTGNVVDAPADGHSLEFCGTVNDRGPSFWKGIVAPTPGASDCVNPTVASTWGRIKTMYR